jgi:serine/threonine-protein kinase RsbW
MKRGLPIEETTRGVPERAEFVLELPSDLRMIEAAVTYLVDRCRSYAFGGPRLSLNFRVGITEALANAVLYGNQGDPGKYVRIEVSIDRIRVCLRVEDEGRGFDPQAVPDPTLPENLHRSGGRGLFLIRELMDEVEFSDRGNAVRLVLHREPERPRRSVRE